MLCTSRATTLLSRNSTRSAGRSRQPWRTAATRRGQRRNPTTWNQSTQDSTTCYMRQGSESFLYNPPSTGCSPLVSTGSSDLLFYTTSRTYAHCYRICLLPWTARLHQTVQSANRSQQTRPGHLHPLRLPQFRHFAVRTIKAHERYSHDV